MQQPGMRQTKGILIAQITLMPILTAAASPFGSSVALSVLIGALVCLMANAVFAFRIFRQYRTQEPESLLARFYGAEFVKLSLALGLFVIVFTTIGDLSVPALFAAYFTVQVLPVILASGRNTY